MAKQKPILKLDDDIVESVAKYVEDWEANKGEIADKIGSFPETNEFAAKLCGFLSCRMTGLKPNQPMPKHGMDILFCCFIMHEAMQRQYERELANAAKGTAQS